MIDNKTIRKVIMLNKMLPGGSPTYENREASGAVANFTTNTVQPFVKCECEILPIQEGTGTPSPLNPRPISGVSSVDIYVTGKNVWDEDWELGGFNSIGEPVPANDRIRSVNYTSIKPNTAYYFKTTNTLGVRYYDIDKVYIGSANGTNTALTTPSNAYFLKLLILNTTEYASDISVNYPSTDTSYHAYTGSTYTVTLEEAAYGGSVDVIAGAGQIIDEYGNLVYTLFEPVNISALEGVNNVWCDTGNIKVTYKYKTGEGGSSTKKYLPIFYDLYGEEKYHDHS